MAFSFSQPQQQSIFQTPSQPQPQQQSIFQTPSQPQPQQQSIFQTPSQPQPQQLHFQFPQSSPGLFQPQQQQFQQQLQSQPQFQLQQPQQQQQQQQILLFTVEKTPANYNTKWTDLHPDSQKFLLQIEDRILEYRDESQRLDQCSRLYDSSVINGGFELESSYIIRELGGISTAMEREKILIQEQMATINNMMRNTEIAVRSFLILRQRFLHPAVSAATSASGASSQTSGSTGAPNTTSQSLTTIFPVYDFYNGVPKRPSPFLQQTVGRFEKYLAECSQWVQELEQLLRPDSDGTISTSGITTLQSLPAIMSNVHDYFVHVTAKVENLHQRIESMKMTFLANRRTYGDSNDPFLEADRRETAKQEAAARRIHPTLHLPAVPSQPSTQIAGLNASSVVPGLSSSAPQLSSGNSGSSSASTFSIFSNPSSSALFASLPSSSLFSTPSSSAPMSTPFGSASSSMFGSAQPSSLFGSSAPSSSSFGIGSSPAFSTPNFGSGAAVASGASFGGASKSSRPKSRTARR